MIRMIGRAMISRPTTILIDLIVLALMAFSLLELLHEFVGLPGHNEAKEIITDVSVIMIGWGVALEERGSVRDVFHLRGDGDDAWQDQIDQACHGVGVMLLLFGLFAEIFEQIVTLPKTVLSIEIFRNWLLAIGTFFLVCGLVVLVGHIVRLVAMKPDPGPAQTGHRGNS